MPNRASTQIFIHGEDASDGHDTLRVKVSSISVEYSAIEHRGALNVHLRNIACVQQIFSHILVQTWKSFFLK